MRHENAECGLHLKCHLMAYLDLLLWLRILDLKRQTDHTMDRHIIRRQD
jgi:hypothetical protein